MKLFWKQVFGKKKKKKQLTTAHETVLSCTKQALSPKQLSLYRKLLMKLFSKKIALLVKLSVPNKPYG